MSRSTYNNLMMGAPFIIAGILLIFALRWRLNIMSLNEDEASSLGMNIPDHASGLHRGFFHDHGFLRLHVRPGGLGRPSDPHIARMIGGNNNRSVIPMSIGLGAFFMIVMDTFARAATAAEIPISILTAIVGAPVFIHHTFKKNRRCLVMIFRVEKRMLWIQGKTDSEKYQLYRGGRGGAFRPGF
ncbi:MAG: iron chelate uptake ABC transporter family permease subunit [Lachnospiraceae bacterium]